MRPGLVQPVGRRACAYVASKLNPGASDDALGLTIPRPLRAAVEAHRTEAICAVRQRLGSSVAWTDQGRVLHGDTHITYGCNTSQQTAYTNANQGLSCKGPLGP